MRIYKHSTYNYITIVEIPKKELKRIDMELCAQPKETLKSFYDRQTIKPDILINGGFFNMSDGTTCFNYIDNEDTIASLKYYTLGMGVVDESFLIYGDVAHRTDWRDFISAYPPLIAYGKACEIRYAEELDYKARRSILGYNDDTVFVVAIESPGMRFSDMQHLMLALKCDYAINIDGGGSTKILHNGKSITSTMYNREVDNVIAFYLKSEEKEEVVAPEIKKTIYRVQAGAYSNKSGAETLLAKIQSLLDTIGAGYKNAYIRQVNGLWKVQIGAFSVRVNAGKVVNDLKSKGFSAFVTTD